MSSQLKWSEFLPAFEAAAKLNHFQHKKLVDTSCGPLTVWERWAAGPRVYLSAGIHGDEVAGPLALLKIMQEGCFCEGVNWSISPATNPTGLAGNERCNENGLDLNRDYLRQETSEVKAHVAWFKSRAVPELFLSLHEDFDGDRFYLYEINQGKDEPEVATEIIKAVTPWFKPNCDEQIDGHTPRGPGWIYHVPEPDDPYGWPEAIFLAKLGCPLSFTFETPSNGQLESRVAALCAAVRAACVGKNLFRPAK